jgi:putative tricarboxylic transport membrane protein
MNREEWRRSCRPWLRGALLGFPLGSIRPGGQNFRPLCPMR